MFQALVWPAVAGALMCATNESAQTTVRLIVPQQVSAQAASRVAGEAASPSPILMLKASKWVRGKV